MLIGIDNPCEAYPVYNVTTPPDALNDVVANVDSATVLRWCTAIDAYRKVQREIEAEYKRALDLEAP